jgi:membrane-anchored glycerophosphoryl diester phosphodiesterase (GDPDase)
MIVGSIIKNIDFIWAGLWISLACFVLTWLAFCYSKNVKPDSKEAEEKIKKKKRQIKIGFIIYPILIVACSVVIRIGLI